MSDPSLQPPPGFTLDQQAAPPTPPPGFVMDGAAPSPQTSWGDSAKKLLASAGTDLVGDALGAPRALASGADWLAGQVGLHPALSDKLGSIPDPSGSGAPLFPTPDQAKQMAYATTGAEDYTPPSEAGKLVKAGITSAIPAILDPATLPASFGAGAVGMLGSQVFPSHPLAGALIGGALGAGAAQKLGQTLASPLRATTSMTPETAQAISDFQNLTGQTIPAAYLSGNKFARHLQDVSDNFMLSGGSAKNQQIKDAIGTALAKPLDPNATELNNGVMQAAKDRLSQGYDDILSKLNAPVDNQMMTDLQGVVDRAALRNDALAPTAQRQADNILNTAASNNGVLTGRSYKDMTKQGGTVSNVSDPVLASDLKGVMKDALVRNAAPEDVAALSSLDQQYRYMKSLEPVVEAASVTGDITPGKIAQAARNNSNLAYQDGGPLAAIARSARALNNVPDSGTAWKNMIGYALSGGGGALSAGGIEHAVGTAAATIPGLLGGALLNRWVANPILRSKILNYRQINGALKGGPALPSPSAALIGRTLLRTAPASPLATASTANSQPSQ